MGETIYRVLRDHYKSSADRAAFEALESSPRSQMARQRFMTSLSEQLEANTALRLNLLAARTFSDTSSTQSSVSATSGSTAVGRDLTTTHNTIRSSQDTTNSHNVSRSHNRKTSYGGVVVAIFAVVIIIVLIIVGRAVVHGAKDFMAAHTLSGNSTCSDYIGSTDETEKAQVMKDLYLQHNKPEQAADPFIVQNTEYICGNPKNQQVKLDRVAAKA